MAEQASNTNGRFEEFFPAFKKRFGPRGVIHKKADEKVGDTGPLNQKRMQTSTRTPSKRSSTR